MRLFICPISHHKLGMGLTDIARSFLLLLLLIPLKFSHVDWAYLEDWCRRLTGTFQDVYVFTVPLYLPKKDVDGKWRVVCLLISCFFFLWALTNARKDS